jgi:hypothetical protein
MDVKVITKAQKFRSDKRAVIHKEFVPEGQRVNSTFYVEIIGTLLTRISSVRTQFRAEGCWFLLHYNVPFHSALVVKIFLVKHGSSELVSADFILFSKVKTALKGFRMLKTLRKM